MRLQFALLAKGAAGPPDGLLYILGGGINSFWVSEVPTMFKGSLVIRLLADRTEVGRTQRLEVRINDEEGNGILSSPIEFTLAPQMPPQLPIGWPIAMNLNVELTGLRLPKEGQYGIEMLVDGGHVGHEPFQVLVAPPTVTSRGMPPLTQRPAPDCGVRSRRAAVLHCGRTNLLDLVKRFLDAMSCCLDG